MRTRLAYLAAAIVVATLAAPAQQDLLIHNRQLTLTVRAQDGAYEILSHGLEHPVLVSNVGVEVNGEWLSSSAYPHHEAAASSFEDTLGAGRAVRDTFSGLANKPDLICTLRLYEDEPYGDVTVVVRNGTSNSISVQAIRVVDAVGKPLVDLGANEQSDRVLFEGFTEDPTIQIGSLAQAPHGVYSGASNDLIYNLASKQSLMLSALTSERFLTVSHLRVSPASASEAHISSFTVDSTGTTEFVLDRDQIAPAQQVQLSLSVPPGESISSERVMVSAGQDYLQELENYGEAVRRLYKLHFPQTAPIGWWSWTAFYAGITEGETITNAEWLAQHLLPMGYNYFHMDEGYAYARGEYTTANATQFPHGMWNLEHEIAHLGLVPGIWTAPFYVSNRAWVFEHHPEWLVHDAQGKPIRVGYVARHQDELYVLDPTHPGAQDYLRKTYQILTREWGVRYIKLDFMDSTAIEGFFYRPNTSALEAHRIGLKIIRDTVGDNVLLDKDGSPMLSPLGLVDEGRIAPDTGHSFSASRDAVPNIAARFYMQGNFYLSDPDAFSVTKVVNIDPDQGWHRSRTGSTLNEAQVQIVLAALCGGMYEIGDDLPTLGSQPERLALVQNQEILDMNRLGRAARPLDLMTFRPEDQEPSVFFLREDSRQAMLAVFNWAERPLSHTFTLAELGLPAEHPLHAFDALNKDVGVPLQNGTLAIADQPQHSVRLIKLVDDSIPAAAPQLTVQAPSSTTAGQAISLACALGSNSVPAISYHWDFGDGTEANGQNVDHTFTLAGTYSVNLTVKGVDGLSANKRLSIAVSGGVHARFDLPRNRRYEGENHAESNIEPLKH
jgi:hypothetical protein